MKKLFFSSSSKLCCSNSYTTTASGSISIWERGRRRRLSLIFLSPSSSFECPRSTRRPDPTHQRYRHGWAWPPPSRPARTHTQTHTHTRPKMREEEISEGGGGGWKKALSICQRVEGRVWLVGWAPSAQLIARQWKKANLILIAEEALAACFISIIRGLGLYLVGGGEAYRRGCLLHFHHPWTWPLLSTSRRSL